MKKFLDKLEHVILFILAVLMAMIVIVTCYQVVLRYVFKNANKWAEELVRYSVFWASMLGSAVAYRRYKHIRVDIFVNHMPKKMQVVANGLVNLVSLVFLAFLLVSGIKLSKTMNIELSPGMRIPMSVVYCGNIIGPILMIVFLFENIYNEFIDSRREKGRNGA